MGSNESDRISDYPGLSSSGISGGGGDVNDARAQDRCGRAFSARLEDAQQSEYYRTRGTVPLLGTEVQIVRRKRLVAQTTDGESIGNLPTSFNYLAACLTDGWTYVGKVRSVAVAPPIATILVDFAAAPPE
jgi:hypothetical protein